MYKDIFAAEHYLPGNDVKLVPGGEPFFKELLELIDHAKEQIHFQIYIFDEDNTGKEVAEALKRARKRGVDVFMAVDSYGSKSLSPAFVADLKRSGIRFKFFSPLPEHFYILRLGRRMHNKAVVADNRTALVGGINVADKYRGTETEAPWLDFAVRVTGPLCVDLTRLCERIFREKYFGKLRGRKVVKEKKEAGDMYSRLALNDWFRRKNQIGSNYKAAFARAKHSITIMASYFMPSRSIRTALKRASQRGVKVSVLLPGKSDVPMAKRATRYLYQWMLRNKIEIHEWHGSVLHGKMAMVDGLWSTVGSYNLNHLSQYSSIEMNVEVLDKAFAATMNETFAELMKKSEPIPEDHFQHTYNVVNRFLDFVSYNLGRWTMQLIFFAVRRDHRYKEKE